MQIVAKYFQQFRKKKLADRRIQNLPFIYRLRPLSYLCVHVGVGKKKNGASFYNSYLHTKVLLLWFLLYLIKLLCAHEKTFAVFYIWNGHIRCIL